MSAKDIIGEQDVQGRAIVTCWTSQPYAQKFLESTFIVDMEWNSLPEYVFLSSP